MILIFHSFKDLDLDMQVFQIWKTSGTTYLSERFGFSDLDLIWRFFSDLEDFWDDLPVSHLKYNTLDDFQEVFQMSSRKTSSKSRLDFLEVFQEVVWTSWKSSDEVFNQMVLIFHSFKGFSDLEAFWDDLPVSRLKYNALDDF
ncbi:hypothetical protein F2Q69_00035669 [Brassica cretica]|uniref:Uncharacterized protein n=1 Tax=Brassica cretica TaxID=69181 RepID=A0A8S9SUN4_BRACR|nr:hypothetical protein F2Q69_00035669 [Brassica cretica]